MCNMSCCVFNFSLLPVDIASVVYQKEPRACGISPYLGNTFGRPTTSEALKLRKVIM